MALIIRVFGTLEAFPSIDEIIESLEDSDFEVTIETEDEDEEDWEELLVYESSFEGPVDVYRYVDETEIEDEAEKIYNALSPQKRKPDIRRILEVLENCATSFSVELPEEYAEDDNALLMCSLLAQTLVQKCDGFYCVDGEGFFDETGDLVYEVAGE